METIGWSNPSVEYLELKTQIDAAIEQVHLNGNCILGTEVAKFEEEFARYLNTGYAAGVASGTDALRISLHALGISSGDEVITVVILQWLQLAR